MHSFRDLDRHFALLPLDVVDLLSSAAEGRGTERAARLTHPEQLESLRTLAVVQSIETSNAIEGIHAPHERIVALAAETTAPRNRPEQEIAGYRFALAQVHEHSTEIPFEPRYVLQLHGSLYRFTSVRHAGAYKRLDNTVIERDADGVAIVRFVPVDPQRTPVAMDELHARFCAAEVVGRVPHLLLCAAYVLDFLTIHPFTDGNGRMARIITLWLLYRGGYGVGRYVSLEHIISATKASYYEALAASTAGWHENQHDLLPWTRYLLGVIVAAYAELERATSLPPPSGKRAAIERYVAESGPTGFTASELRAVVPVSRDYLGKVLRELRDAGVVVLTGAGRGARWRRQDA